MFVGLSAEMLSSVSGGDLKLFQDLHACLVDVLPDNHGGKEAAWSVVEGRSVARSTIDLAVVTIPRVGLLFSGAAQPTIDELPHGVWRSIFIDEASSHGSVIWEEVGRFVKDLDLLVVAGANLRSAVSVAKICRMYGVKTVLAVDKNQPITVDDRVAFDSIVRTSEPGAVSLFTAVRCCLLEPLLGEAFVTVDFSDFVQAVLNDDIEDRVMRSVSSNCVVDAARLAYPQRPVKAILIGISIALSDRIQVQEVRALLSAVRSETRAKEVFLAALYDDEFAPIREKRFTVSILA